MALRELFLALVIQVKTDSRFMHRRIVRNSCGTRFLTRAMPAHPQVLYLAVSQRAIHLDSRPACHSTVTRSTKQPRSSKRISVGFANWIRATLSVANHSRARKLTALS